MIQDGWEPGGLASPIPSENQKDFIDFQKLTNGSFRNDLGWVILGVMMMVTSFFIAMFPRELPEATERRWKTKREAIHKIRRGSHGVLSLPNTPADLAKVGSQILLPTENSGDNPLPKVSGKRETWSQLTIFPAD